MHRRQEFLPSDIKIKKKIQTQAVTGGIIFHVYKNGGDLSVPKRRKVLINGKG